MTIGANVKGCYFAIKSAEASFAQLSIKATTDEAREVFLKAEEMIKEIKTDLEKQVIFLANEEPQYK